MLQKRAPLLLLLVVRIIALNCCANIILYSINVVQCMHGHGHEHTHNCLEGGGGVVGVGDGLIAVFAGVRLYD